MKKTLALILSLALALSSMTVGVFAEAEGSQPADPAVNVLDENVPADQDVQDGDVVTEQPADTDVEPAPEATDPAPDEDVVPQDEEEDVAKNSLLDDEVTENDFTVQAAPAGSTSATVTWSYTEKVDPTLVQSVQVEGQTADPAAKSFTVNNLQPGSAPSFKVVFSYKIDEDNTKTFEKTTNAVTLPIDTVKNLAAYSAYKSVALEWDPVNGATSYKVYRNGTLVNGNVSASSRAYDNPNKMAYIDKTGDESETKYSYYVTAVVGDKESAPSATVSKASVTQLYITVTFKETRKLKSHDKAKKKRTFKKGTKVQCHSFKFGKYIFYYQGNLYYCNYLSLRKFKANMAKGAPKQLYNDKEAEYFALTSGKNSSTNYMIWANLYSQHLYVLTRDSKSSPWRVAKNLNYKKTNAYHWNVSSGKADTPSPAGMNFTLKKHKKLQRGVKWLTFYHSQTSLHGKVGNQDFRTLRSGGCIRNPDKYAELIYKKVPLKTRLIVY